MTRELTNTILWALESPLYVTLVIGLLYVGCVSIVRFGKGLMKLQKYLGKLVF